MSDWGSASKKRKTASAEGVQHQLEVAGPSNRQQPPTPLPPPPPPKIFNLKQKAAVAEGVQHQLTVAGPLNRQQPPSSPSDPKIFKLTADCCDEIFEYLSLKDLHSFGQTCKTFNKVAGEYFKQNYSALYFRINEKGAYVLNPRQDLYLPAFHNYITKVYSCNRTAPYLARRSDEFTSLKGLQCTTVTLKPNAVLQQIECLSLTVLGTSHDMNFNGEISKICPNLEYLSVKAHSVRFREYSGRRFGRKGRSRIDASLYADEMWLHQIFPNLTQVECKKMPRLDKLNAFFERNPSVNSLSVEFENIWRRIDSLLSSTIKLDLLKVDEFRGHPPESIDVFNQLYERGFYKRLHLSMNRMGQQYSDKLLRLKGLERLSIGIYEPYSLPKLNELKGLDLRIGLEIFPYSNETEVLANGLLSVNLRKIRVFRSKHKVLNLLMLNKEREKLAGARKITIFVENDVYLATKWATKNGDTNLSLVEMRRNSSLDWDTVMD